MPGIVTHALAGLIISTIGLFYYREYFENDTKKQITLVAVSLLFSFIPDTFLAFYYITHALPFEVLAYYHRYAHMLSPVIAVICLILLRFDPKRKPYWAVALWAIIVHLVMDLLIQETGPFF